MKKRILSLLLAALLLLAVLPWSAMAIGGLPDLNNLKVSADGLVTWDPYPGAAHYYVYDGEFWPSIRVEPEDGCSLDFQSLLSDNYAPNGTYELLIAAEDEGYNNVALSKLTWTFTAGLAPLPAPEHPRWDGYTACWDAVSGVQTYTLDLYNAADLPYLLERWSITDLSKDLSYYLRDKAAEYVFRVRADGCPGGSQSPWSAWSGKVNGRFVYGDLTLSLDADGRLSWPAYVDTEGLPAVRYYVYQDGENPACLPADRVYGTALDLKWLFGSLEAPAGVYKFSIDAENAEGLTVSKQSNTVAWSYTPETGVPRVKMLGWDCPEGWTEQVLFRDLDWYYSQTYSVPTDQGNLELRIFPNERYKVVGIRLDYGGTVHSEPEKMGVSVDADGVATAWFTPPAEDFTVIIDQEAVYDLLPGAAVTLPVEAGRAVPFAGLAADDAPYSCVINAICTDNNSDCTSWFLPGDCVDLSITFIAKTWEYYKWAADAAFTVNGQSAAVTSRSPDGDEVTVRISFKVPDAASFTLEKTGTSLPRFGLAIDANGLAAWSAVPGAADYYLYSFGFGPTEAQQSIDPSTLTFDFRAALQAAGAPTGWYVLLLSAEDGERSDIAFDYAPYYYEGLPQLPAPTNLRWDGFKACWDAVEGAESYSLVLYLEDRVYYGRTFSTKTPFLDLSEYIPDRSETYAFRVYACSRTEGVADSKPSVLSPGRPGRFEMNKITVTLTGDVAAWPAYVDTEGETAYCYCFWIGNDSLSVSRLVYATSLNLRQVLGFLNIPDGDYDFEVCAQRKNGLTVSAWSDDVTYHYAADPGRATVKLSDWVYDENSSGSGLDALLLNGICLNGGFEYTLNVGETVTVTLLPREGCSILALSLQCGETRTPIALTQNADGTYAGAFTVPDSDCKLVVRTGEAGSPFEDVKESDWFYAAVLWAISQDPKITSGTDATHFSPTKTCSRAEVVQFLWNAAGQPAVAAENPFEDVKEGDWFYKAVIWAVKNGITSGVDAKHFAPTKTCSRAEVVQFLRNAAGKPEPAATDNPFDDVKESDWFYASVLWAVEKGITAGTTPTTFAPTKTCTRAEVVQFLYKAAGV